MKKGIVFLVVLATVACIATLGLAGGCASSTLPPALTQSQHALVQATRFGVTLGIERYKFPAYSDHLAKALRETQLFGQIADLNQFRSPPALVARVERPIHGRAVVPVLTGITLGLIPTTVQEEHGYSFSLASPGGSAERIPVEFSYSGPTTLGWYSLVLNISADRTKGNLDDHPRFRDGLAWALVEKRNQIYALVKKPAA